MMQSLLLRELLGQRQWMQTPAGLPARKGTFQENSVTKYDLILLVLIAEDPRKTLRHLGQCWDIVAMYCADTNEPACHGKFVVGQTKILQFGIGIIYCIKTIELPYFGSVSQNVPFCLNIALGE